MSLLGTGALAMWWDIDDDVRPEFEDWHSHEHFVERMSIPGFLRGTRWTEQSGGPGIFVLYELESFATLSSPGYLERLNAPSPWSTAMMPHHRSMVRSQSHVLASRGSALAGHALTVRLSPLPERAAALQTALAALAAELVVRPGITGAHLLRHEAPPIAQTTEQRIRGADAVADWVFVATGYQGAALAALASNELCSSALGANGAAPVTVATQLTLSHSATRADIR